MQAFVVHPHGEELEAMSVLLDALPDDNLEAIHADLVRDRRSDTGRPAMTAEQVLRALVVKQLNGFTYHELGFHLVDSRCYRTFCRFGEADRVPGRSTLQANIKRVRPETLETVNRSITRLASSTGVESGAKIRVDCTSVETHIHPPTDSRLLWDVLRVLTRLLIGASEHVDVAFTNHQRRAKRRMNEIRNARRQADRVAPYRDLVTVTEITLSSAREAVVRLLEVAEPGTIAERRARAMSEYIDLGERVISQTCRRVFDGEKVPAREKVLSIFEPHTDLLVKGPGDPEYGHKICLSTGASGLVLDCMILDGNPADVTLTTKMVSRHKDLCGHAPRQAAFDGAFASRANLQALKDAGVRDVAFSKRCGLPLSAMARSSWVYKRLRDFRAGIEGCISFLKRCFGLTRCTWRSFTSFKSYVQGSVVAANLLIMARHRIALGVT